jgi:hypothetical protein
LNKIIVFLILFIATLRGYLVLISLPSNIVFGLSSFLVILLVILFSFKYYKKSPIYSNFKKVNNFIFYNTLFFTIYIILEIIFSLSGIVNVTDLSTASLYYIFVSPFFIYIFNFNTINLKNILFIISIFLCASILYESKFYFIDGGYNLLLEYRQKFRPNEVIGLAGNNFQLAGVVADHHDMANLLGMLTVFFFNQYCVDKKVKNFLIFLLLLISLLLTVSATNIVLTLFFVFLIMIYFKSVRSIILLLSILLLTTFLNQDVISVFNGFTNKFGADSNSNALFGFLSIYDILKGVPFLMLGHGTSFDTPIIRSEISFIKLLFGFGILHFVTLINLVLYPIFMWRKNGYPNIASGEMFSILFGFVSLLHYGSLMRVTSIFLFFSLYSVALLKLITFNNKKII